jgi:hypothetical protein
LLKWTDSVPWCGNPAPYGVDLSLPDHEADDEPNRFWTYVVTALRAAVLVVGGRRAQANLPRNPGPPQTVGPSNITFKGRGFAWVDHSENRAMIKARHHERDALLATTPAVYEAGWATNSSAWVRVRLELADPQEVFELLEEAWRMTATKGAIKAFDEAGRQPAPSRAAAWHWR